MDNNIQTPKKNSTQIIEITSVTAKGFGVGHINGFTVFVDGGLPGDELKIYMLKAKPRYGYGKIIEILRPSPHRIESPCQVFDRCGGCQWLNCEYKAQLGFKKQIVIDALERIGQVKNPPVQDVMGMLKPVNYRNKAVFPVVPTGFGAEPHFTIGMFSARSHRIVEVENCSIQHPAHVAVLKVVKKYMRRNKVSPYDEITHRGLMRFIMIRTSLATKEVMVVLTVNGNGLPLEPRLAEDLERVGVTTVVISRHTAKNNVVLGEHFRVISGSGFIRERVGHVTYQISAPSFCQINPVQTKALYEVAVTQADLKGKTVLDAHVGAGGVSLYSARHAKEILGVDIVQAAINDGEKNAELNNIDNLRFICGAAEEVIPKLFAEPDANLPEVVFLDPPRRGCEPALLDALVNAKIERIVYISCDPATFARDVKILVEGGYSLETVQPVDMFPHTGKVEVTALLLRVK
ncbi:MAG: 23S rRNA (uracil(1939)-C(5))-methyltransferase RlmD [Firmicutes bacterium]|nr:23S rRNA (uracil(1939)-C(5))-methyltransferase RlmD [Bacillota bacterium]